MTRGLGAWLYLWATPEQLAVFRKVDSRKEITATLHSMPISKELRISRHGN
jgi:hypothetical protein